MNIEQANAIPLAQILEKITTATPKRIGQELVYSSPLREENTPSFHVHPGKNLWFDFGEGRGGDVIGFLCAYLRSTGEAHTVQDALRWLRNMTGLQPRIHPVTESEPVQQEKKLALSKVTGLKHRALLNYLDARGIPHRLAKLYLREVWLYNKEKKKHVFALGFRNENGGYELRNPYLKISIKKKGITFVRGEQPKPDAIHLFEGFMDFLSALASQSRLRFTEDAIIFNSLSLMEEATPLIHNYGYRTAYTWMDNDAAGERATQSLAEFFKAEDRLTHKPMNDSYATHKDVNAWRMHNLAQERSPA
jgi:DNA primase